MEYSVYDLIRILRKKWYIILLSMCLVGGLSVITARQSYAKALTDYERYTSEMVENPVETGTTIAIYYCDYRLTDVKKYTEQARQKEAFIQQYLQSIDLESSAAGEKPSAYSDALQAYEAASADFFKLLTDPKVISNVQLTINQLGYTEAPSIGADGSTIPGTALVVGDHLTIEQLDTNSLQLTVFGVSEGVATDILNAYFDSLSLLGETLYSMDITLKENTLVFAAQPPQLTDAAEFAQMVMKKPEQQPILVKTVGTAAIYAFALSCFLVLFFTFIKETKASAKGKDALS